MVNQSELYTELKEDIESIANSLFGFSEQCLKERGNFYPFGAVLNATGDIEFVTAAADGDLTNSTEILPLLHAGLRAQAKEEELTAIAVAENVTVTQDGQASTEAVKILFEHKRGLVVALYMPFKKRLIRGYSFGEIFTVLTEGEVNAWS